MEVFNFLIRKDNWNCHFHFFSLETYLELMTNRHQAKYSMSYALPPMKSENETLSSHNNIANPQNQLYLGYQKTNNPIISAFNNKLNRDYQNYINEFHHENDNSKPVIVLAKSLPVSTRQKPSLCLPTKKISQTSFKSSKNAPKPLNIRIGVKPNTFDESFNRFDSNYIDNENEMRERFQKAIQNETENEQKQKIEKAKQLHTVMVQKRNEKKQKMIDLAVACHQDWGLIKYQQNLDMLHPKFDDRPITATTQEALDELKEFEKKQIDLLKQKKIEDKLEEERCTEESSENDDVDFLGDLPVILPKNRFRARSSLY